MSAQSEKKSTRKRQMKMSHRRSESGCEFEHLQQSCYVVIDPRKSHFVLLLAMCNNKIEAKRDDGQSILKWQIDAMSHDAWFDRANIKIMN